MSPDDDREASVPRELWRQLRRHPRDLPERLLVLAVQRQGRRRRRGPARA
jgi:hypothetical protein